jgi:hypothetical protein
MRQAAARIRRRGRTRKWKPAPEEEICGMEQKAAATKWLDD